MFNRAVLIAALFLASLFLGVMGFDHLSMSVSRLIADRSSTLEDQHDN